MEPLDLDKIAHEYNNRSVIWPKTDRWHYWTYKSIARFIKRNVKATKADIILNAGSGGNEYSLPGNNMYHLDIASEKIKGLRNNIIGSIEKIPLEENFFDKIVCVGSVINYCNPETALHEFKRVLKQNGELILEFENSHTLELIGSDKLNKDAVLMRTFYGKEEHVLRYFSEKYITNILHKLNFEILTIYRFHILSPLLYGITHNTQVSAVLGYLDPCMRLVPFLRRFSSNVIIYAKLT